MSAVEIQHLYNVESVSIKALMQRFRLKRHQVRKLLKSEETGVVQVQPDKRQKFKKLDQGSRQLIKDLLT